MKKEPLFYDENRPLAHYAAAGKLKKSSERAILFGKIYPLIILPLGVACAIFEPLSMALFTLFGALCTALAWFGCGVKRMGPTMAAAPLAIAAAAVLLTAGSFLAIAGGVLYLIEAAGLFRAMYGISSINMLKELPGFPFFDPAMDGISFAAMEHHGADEYIEGELVEEHTERIKLVPTEPPSEEMSEIVTGEIEAPAEILELPQLEGEPSAYEKMINIQVPEREEVSDVDLLY